MFAGSSPRHLAAPLCFPQARPGPPSSLGGPNSAVSFSGSSAAEPQTRPFSLLSWFPCAAAHRAGGRATRLPCPIPPTPPRFTLLRSSLPKESAPCTSTLDVAPPPWAAPWACGPTKAQSPERGRSAADAATHLQAFLAGAPSGLLPQGCRGDTNAGVLFPCSGCRRRCLEQRWSSLTPLSPRRTACMGSVLGLAPLVRSEVPACPTVVTALVAVAF